MFKLLKQEMVFQVLRKSVSDSVQEGCDFHMTNNNAKLRKMWALVAEESSLTNSKALRRLKVFETYGALDLLEH
uniref:Uncharacterized protein n=1 Tax=Wuchereria bancrofti TaxID=6293 RepID=A0AAF5PHV4_WUCBA